MSIQEHGPYRSGKTKISIRNICALVIVLLCTSCATPVEVKQALADMDDGYRANAALGKNYWTLVRNLNERHRDWYRYVQQRNLLHLALIWVTRDPTATVGSEDKPDFVDAAHQLLGDEVVATVNQMRLAGLPKAAGKDLSGFEAGPVKVSADGRGSMDVVIHNMPALVRQISEKVDNDHKSIAQHSVADIKKAFDAYATNVRALRTISATIRRYLEIDVTVAPEDVKAIADGIRQLQE